MVQGFNALIDRMEEMRDIAVRYSDYRPVQVKELPFRAPQNEMEVEAFRGEKLKEATLLGVFTAVLIGLALCLFQLGSGIAGPAVILLFGLVLLGLLIKVLVAPPMVLPATVVYKTFKYSSGGGTRRKNYYVTVVTETPEKMIAQMITISKRNYETATEGTSVIVVKALSACAILSPIR